MTRAQATAEAAKLATRYPIHVQKVHGCYSVTSSSFPADTWRGDTEAGALSVAYFGISQRLVSMILNGKEIPPPLPEPH